MSQNLPPAGHPDWVAAAIRAIAAFELDLDSLGMAAADTVEHLLAMWRHRHQLTDSQVRRVVALVTGAHLPGGVPADLEQTVPLPVDPPTTRTLTTTGTGVAVDPSRPHLPAVRVRVAGPGADCDTCSQPLVWSRNAWRHTVGGE